MGEVRNIVELFYDAAERYPQKTAIIEDSERITFSDLKVEVELTAAYFEEKGIQAGDRVLVFVGMSIDLYRSLLALFHIGATAVFVDEWADKERLQKCCDVADCKGFLGGTKARLFGWISSPLRKIPIKLKTSKRGEKKVKLQKVNSDTGALITFTTGSTGVPKAAFRTHQFLKFQFDALIEEIKPKEDDIDMPTLPIVLFMNLGKGNTSIIADYNSAKPDTLDAHKVLQQLANEKATRLICSPFFALALAKEQQKRLVDLPHLKNLFTGGAPVFSADAFLLDRAFPNVLSTIVYGSTESEPISSISSYDLTNSQGFNAMQGLPVGKIAPGVQLKIVPVSSEVIDLVGKSIESIELPQGQVGEIVVSGNHVLKQYFRNEEAFAQNKIIDGSTIWHRTGDSGFVQNNTDLFLLGRCSQLIFRGDMIVSPFIYEDRLSSIIGVSIGTVILVNEEITLVLEKNGDAEEKDIQFSCERLGLSYDQLIFVDKIPRDPRHNSKIDYPALKEIL